jgi:hypothetical protein
VYLWIILLPVFFLLPISTTGIASADVIRPPVVSAVNTPLEPPPGYEVNVTATVNSYPRTISNVYVRYWSSNATTNQTVSMVFVEGNATYGIFFARLPSYPEMTRVTYSVVAIDTSGFQGQSDLHTFTVKADRTPPSFAIIYSFRGYQDSPLTPWTQVEVKYDVIDSGSGVNQVVVRFSNASDPNHSLSLSSALHLTQGDRYNGNWSGLIPKMNVNGTVYYSTTATDFYGNMITSDLDHYPVYALSEVAYANVQVVATDLNLQSRALRTYVFLTGYYPSKDVPEALYVNIRTTSPSYGQAILRLNRVSGFYYEGSMTINSTIQPGLYPFDSYQLELMIQINAPGLQPRNVTVDYLQTFPFATQFDQLVQKNGTDVEVAQYGEVQILSHVLLTRKSSLIDPLMSFIYAVFFIIGSVEWLETEDLKRRLEIFLGLFTFLVVLFFTYAQNLEKLGVSGSSVPLPLLISLVWSVTALLATNLALAYFRKVGWQWTWFGRRHSLIRSHAASFAFCVIASIVTLSFSPFLFMIPLVCGLVICGIFYSTIIKVAFDLYAFLR